MDVGLDADQRAWVAEVRTFLQENVTPALEVELAEHGLERSGGEVAAFRRRVGERGWFGVTWPTEYGGLGLSDAPGCVTATTRCATPAPTEPSERPEGRRPGTAPASA